MILISGPIGSDVLLTISYPALPASSTPSFYVISILSGLLSAWTSRSMSVVQCPLTARQLDPVTSAVHIDL